MVIGWQRSGKQNVSTMVKGNGAAEENRASKEIASLLNTARHQVLAFPYRPSNRAFHSCVKGKPRQHDGKRGFVNDKKTFSNDSVANH